MKYTCMIKYEKDYCEKPEKINKFLHFYYL